jgi:hypothetical protein
MLNEIIAIRFVCSVKIITTVKLIKLATDSTVAITIRFFGKQSITDIAHTAHTKIETKTVAYSCLLTFFEHKK